MDLRSTLNLPDQDFTIPMKANLSQQEPERLAKWDQIGIYTKVQEARNDAPTYVLHDGPPYTNSPIHLGTALNKILKDFVVRSKTMAGYRAPYVPGFDNHGLPIEQAVMKTFREQKIEPDLLTLRKACRDHAQKYIDLQSTQFKRIGVTGLWKRPYFTMEYRFEAEIVRVFKRLVEKGFIYRGLRPVLWSPTSRTALADTEIVYKDHVSKAIFVAFPLSNDSKGVLSEWPEVEAVIWTTTPWTIPANLALAFHPTGSYVVVEVDGRRFLLAEELLEKTAEKIGWDSPKVVGRLSGSDLEGIEFSHPVYDRVSLAVLADYVTMDEGTGIVHTAPGHGRDDFMTGKKYGLPILSPVDDKGILTEEAGEFAGVSYKDCDVVVVDRLEAVGRLLHSESYSHSYPHAERDERPVIFRATEQWFLNVDHGGLRQSMLDEIDKVGWIPASARSRISTMIENRPDWCISRQRPWGVGIPIFYGAESGEPVLDTAAIECVAKLVEERGSDAWYDAEPSEILPDGYTHPQTGEREFRKEVDVFDVWFDSGSTSFCVLEGNVDERWNEEWPADLYLEGTDQHRGWFNVSLILGTALTGTAPYRTVLTHGFVTDDQGRKMSKRLGNVIDPIDVCDRQGADVLRYWVASVRYGDDVPCSDQLLQVAGEGYRRIRNTLRFLLSNLYDYQGETEVTDPLDVWAVEKTRLLAYQMMEAYGRFDFTGANQAINNFCVNTLSGFYADVIKDRLYCDGADWPSRRSATAAIHEILVALTKLVAPILPYTAEEVYERIPLDSRLESVHMESLSPISRAEADQLMKSDLHRRMDAMLSLRSKVFAKFEEFKSTGAAKDTQDVSATVHAPADQTEPISGLNMDLAMLFKMASITLVEGKEFSVEFEVSSWEKCDRSRVRRSDVAESTYLGEKVLLSARDRRALGLE